MRVMFLGFTVPQSEFEYISKLDSNMPIQTHKFAWSVVRALVKNNIEVDLLSSHPVTNFPSTKKIVFNKMYINNEWADGIILPFINVLLLKHITRFLSCIAYGTARVINFKPDFILIHGIHSPFLYFSLLLKLLFNQKVVVILTDPPNERYANDHKISLLLKKIDKILIKKSLICCDGIVALTENLAQDFAPNVPYIVMEGIFDESAVSLKLAQKNNKYKKTILYAGGLSEKYGLGFLLDSFKKIYYNDVCLKIFGKGDFEYQLISASKEDDRIDFGGFCSNSEVLAHMKKADILVNPRPSGQSFVKYSFPSKIIEYMSTGTPVLTTNLPGIPEEYKKYLYIIPEETEDGLSNSLNQLLSMSKEELKLKGLSAKSFIEEFKTEQKQGDKMFNFFVDIKNNRDK